MSLTPLRTEANVRGDRLLVPKRQSLRGRTNGIWGSWGPGRAAASPHKSDHGAYLTAHALSIPRRKMCNTIHDKYSLHYVLLSVLSGARPYSRPLSLLPENVLQTVPPPPPSPLQILASPNATNVSGRGGHAPPRSTQVPGMRALEAAREHVLIYTFIHLYNGLIYSTVQYVQRSPHLPLNSPERDEKQLIGVSYSHPSVFALFFAPFYILQLQTESTD